MADAVAAKRSRIDSVDLLRGLVMVIMLLDHTRDFVHNDAFRFDPADMSRTYPTLFFTRWITHFCAPIFVFLAGTGSYFQLARGKSKSELSRFLLTRGLWLIVLEMTVVRLAAAWEFHVTTLLGFMQVIWALGWSMIVLSALVYLPIRVIAWFGILMIALHNLLDRFVVTAWNGPGSPSPNLAEKIWITLHQGGAFPIAGASGPIVVMFYPLIPWIGVMAVGYAFGRVYDWPQEERKRWLMRVGIATTAAFVLIRASNRFGDPGEWAAQKTIAMTIVSFLNLQKYPPSLLYLLMTLGPAMIALALWERYNAGRAEDRGPLVRFFVTFGRVPLFFYILQWIIAHSAGYFLALLAHKPTEIFFEDPLSSKPPPGEGFDLWVVYCTWIVGVLLLYPACKWFAGLKQRRKDWWLSYL